MGSWRLTSKNRDSAKSSSRSLVFLALTQRSKLNAATHVLDAPQPPQPRPHQLRAGANPQHRPPRPLGGLPPTPPPTPLACLPVLSQEHPREHPRHHLLPQFLP